VDHLPLEGVDVVADLNKPLDLFPENSVSAIYSNHVFEHIQEFMGLMKEVHRITRPKGGIEIIVPHFSNAFGYSDPTHVRFFGLYTMNYFVAPEKQQGARKVPIFYSDTRFVIKDIKIEFYPITIFDRFFNQYIKRLINYSATTQNFYERRLSSIFHAWQIRYVMTPDK